MERLIQEKVKSGRYRSTDDVVREGLELLQEREEEMQVSPSNGTDNFGAAFESISKSVPEGDWKSVPSDLAKNLDQYLYGAKKTS